MSRLFLGFALIVAVACSAIPTSSFAQDAKAKKAVLITGASTGIGRLAAEQLAAEGYFVYAGARKKSDIDALNEIDRVMAVRLNVTKQSEIDAAMAIIESEGRGPWGIVNNAGINLIDPLIEARESDLDFLFDENPKEHYLVIPEQFQAMITISKAFEEVLYLNHDHDHSYTRDQLIALMDEQAAALNSGTKWLPGEDNQGQDETE